MTSTACAPTSHGAWDMLDSLSSGLEGDRTVGDYDGAEIMWLELSGLSYMTSLPFFCDKWGLGRSRLSNSWDPGAHRVLSSGCPDLCPQRR